MAFQDDHDYVQIPIENWMSVETHINAVQTAAVGLVRATVECEMEPDYGGDRAVMYVCGYKPLTREEKAEKRKKRAQEDAEYEQREREELERLRKKYEN